LICCENITQSNEEAPFDIVLREIRTLAAGFKTLNGTVTALAADVTALSTDFKTLNGTVTALSTDVTALSTVLKTMNGTMTTSFLDFRNQFTNGMQSFHDFGRKRVEVMESATGQVTLQSFGCEGVATIHSFYLDGHVGQFLPTHFYCANATLSQRRLLDQHIVAHPNYDLGLVVGQCPDKTMKFALDLSNYTDAQLGDNVVSFGHGATAKAWTGSVSDVQKRESSSSSPPLSCTPWTNSTDSKIAHGEIVVQSFQHRGMSGGAVCNGCGYLGMSHTVMKDNLANFAHIIPADEMILFAKKNIHRLKKLKDCPDVAKVSLPIMPFMNCHIRFSSDLEII